MLQTKQQVLLSTSVIFSLSAVQHFIALAIGVLTLVHIIMQVVSAFPKFKENLNKISKLNKIIISVFGVLILALVFLIIFFFG